MSRRSRTLPWLILAITLPVADIEGGDEFEQPPIEYSQTEPNNVVSQLQEKLDGGETTLDFVKGHGYLPALLEALDVTPESQMLVFSKTSLQRQRISPRTPRAIYFNDDVYIGFCLSGDVLEISVADAKVGTAFYTLDQQASDVPEMVRQTDSCLICHSSSRTTGIPGHLVRSLYTDPSGQPIFSAGSHTVDHTTPIADRWGGWYVTGKHGDQQHLGNLVIPGKQVTEPVDNTAGQNVTDLSERFRVQRYLAPHSDIVALMVLEHQTLVHNHITKANFATRQALHYQATMNRALKEPPGQRYESTTRRISGAGDDLVETLLMVDEAELTAPLEGTSRFAQQFSQRGPHDSLGRSLRDFDLQRRMFKYPCSYLIYSDAFRKLPSEVRDYVWQRLWQVLAENADAETFAHLTEDDKRSIIEILRETVDDLPPYWKTDAQKPQVE